MQSIISILSLAVASTAVGYLTPSPNGRYNVTVNTGELIDCSRNAPYAAKPTPVALMLSVFQPAKCASPKPVAYMPKKTAKYQGPFLEQTFNISTDLSPLFLGAHLPACSEDGATTQGFPILLFSPGYSIPRLYYSVLASSISSEGFIVITIDHPNDANIIVYPNGKAVYNNDTITDSPTWDEYPNAADVTFIIDQLSNATAMGELLPHRGAHPFPVDRIAMFGHSIGGASSIVAASLDSRIRAAVNWDGTIFGSPDLSNVTQPVMFLSHNPTIPPDWKKALSQMKGSQLVARIANTTHETFSDVPTLIQSSGQSSAPFADILGTIAPDEMVRILTTYTTKWMHGAF